MPWNQFTLWEVQLYGIEFPGEPQSIVTNTYNGVLIEDVTTGIIEGSNQAVIYLPNIAI